MKIACYLFGEKFRWNVNDPFGLEPSIIHNFSRSVQSHKWTKWLGINSSSNLLKRGVAKKEMLWNNLCSLQYSGRRESTGPKTSQFSWWICLEAESLEFWTKMGNFYLRIHFHLHKKSLLKSKNTFIDQTLQELMNSTLELYHLYEKRFRDFTR